MPVIRACSRNRILTDGFTLIEVLVTLVVITLGLLGLAALQGHALKAEAEAYYRVQATLLLEDMQDRLNTNRRVPGCFVATYGKGVATANLSCTAGSDGDARNSAQSAMQGWNNLLLGVTEKIGSTSVGTLPDARGCVIQEGVTNLYYIAVAWQGISETAAPVEPSDSSASLKSAIACGVNQYGNESARRVIWVPVRIADLNLA
jgi:type IV pilus assembly protein PilV